MWDSTVFVGNQVLGDDNFLVVKGYWKGVDGDVCVINMYGPQADDRKSELWNRLAAVIDNLDAKWRVFGDFNETRKPSERKNNIFKVK